MTSLLLDVIPFLLLFLLLLFLLLPFLLLLLLQLFAINILLIISPSPLLLFGLALQLCSHHLRFNNFRLDFVLLIFFLLLMILFDLFSALFDRK